MPVAWESLSELFATREGNPTIDALLGLAEAIDGLGKDKPPAKAEAMAKLEDVARRVIGKDSEEPISALMKKATRLDKFLDKGNKKFHGLLKAWQDEKVDRSAWGAMLDECEPKLTHLRNIAESIHRLLHPDRTGTIITVETTRILSSRFWARVLAEFYRQVEAEQGTKDVVRIDVITREPYTLIHDGESPGSDLILTYLDASAETAEKWRRKKFAFASLHRCVLFPLRIDDGAPTSFSFDVFNGRRVAVLADASRVSPQFPWKDMTRRASDVAERQSHIELHSFVRGQCGLAVSCLEFLDELDEMELQYMEIPAEEGGSPYIVCATRPDGDAGGDPQKVHWLNVLLEIVRNRIEKLKTDYTLAKTLTEHLRRYAYSYSTTGIRSLKGQEAHARRGRVSLQVTPSLLVHGVLVLERAPTFPDEERREAESYRLFGRVQQGDDSNAQLVLRAMSEDGREISMGSFVLEVADDGIHTPGLSRPCLVGHWLGRERASPNAGVWILHSQEDLKTADIKKIIGNMAELYPLSLYPSETKSVVRFGKLH